MLAALALAALALHGCGGNNIGRAFDPDVGGGGGGGGSGEETNVRVVPVGGDVVEGRPAVDNTFPEGGGWPTTVPIVVVFNESMSEDALAPPDGSGADPTLFLRVQGTMAALPVSYDFLLGGRAVVLRPLAPLMPGEETIYEVVITSEARDVDGTRFGGEDEEILSTFTVAEDDPDDQDGEILTVLPIDNAELVDRAVPVFAIFTRPADETSVTTANFNVRPTGGAPLAGALSFPISTMGVTDTRVLRFDPTDLLVGDAVHEIRVDETITFAGGDGRLDFRGRSPFATFQTLPIAPPISVAVGNPTAGFADKVNLNNLANLTIDVELDASAGTGDSVLVRVYGLAASTTATTDLDFVERTADVPTDGAQTVAVDFAGALGVEGRAEFDDGALVLAAQLQRGRSRRSGFVQGDPDADARFDLTRPTLMTLGPPTATNGTDIVTEQEVLSFFGQASERLGSAELTVGGTTATMFASADGGTFAMLPITLGRLTGVLPYTLTVTDAAGNTIGAPLSGNVRQFGVITGGAISGRLTVEVYDEATFERLSGVTVVLDPGAPVKPAAAGQTSAVTNANGRAAFTGLAASSYSITVVRDGYDLRTWIDVGSRHVSLPLRPSATADATATVNVTAAFVPMPGQVAMAGTNAFADPLQQDSVATGGTATMPDALVVRPNRPLIVTAFAGTFEPTLVPTFTNFACQVCGADGATPTAPFAPPAPGGMQSLDFVLLPATGTAVSLAAAFTKDFSTAAGLGAISGTPVVRITGSVLGFDGQALFGVGFASDAGGSSFEITGTYSLTSFLNLVGYLPTLWVSTEAEDVNGNVSRHRRLITDPNLGVTLVTADVPGIPTISTPAGPINAVPAVSYADVLDPMSLPGGFAFTELTAVDEAGRRWDVVVQDFDGTGSTDTVQFPDLRGVVGVTGLAAGTWAVTADNTLMLGLTSAVGDFVLEERRRQQVTFARASATQFTIR